MGKGLVALGLVLLAGAAHAQTSVPHSFSSGQPARAAEVNANFQALATAINNLTARVDRLEGAAVTAANVAGTYQLFGLQTGIAPSGSGLIETITYTGTVTLAGGGTYTGSLTESANVLGVGNPPNLSSRSPTDALAGSYSINSTRITLNTFGGSDPIDFYGAAGARILVAATSGVAPPPGFTFNMGTNVMLILVRTN